MNVPVAEPPVRSVWVFVVLTFGIAWGLAGLVVWLDRKAMFARERAATEVIPRAG